MGALLCCALVACGSPIGRNSEVELDPKTSLSTLPPKEGDEISASDYSSPTNWLSVDKEADMPVDVFIVYPTTYSQGIDGSFVSTITDENMRTGAAAWLEARGSAFETVGNVYAPFYRQNDANWLLTMSNKEQVPYIKGTPYTDIVAAFEYYLDHFNKGRPFILASHSQGSSLTKYLVYDYMAEHPEVYERMVACYSIGYSVTQDELDAHSHVKFAEGASDTGVLISYNTEAENIEGKNPVYLEGSVSINPISWTRDETEAPASDSRGAYIDQGNGLEKVTGLANARLDNERGVVVCSSVDMGTYSMPEEMRGLFPLGVYHNNDIPFYYFDLRHNAELRISTFLTEHPEYAS